MNGKHQLTPAGLEKYKKELDNLIKNERARVIESLKEARAQGDLSENADWDVAREDQARIENRIIELENIIKNAEIIANDNSSASNLGKTVILEFEDKSTDTFTIVGSLESDPLAGKISNESPLGSAILNHKSGDRVLVKTDTGSEFYVVIKQIN